MSATKRKRQKRSQQKPCEHKDAWSALFNYGNHLLWCQMCGAIRVGEARWVLPELQQKETP